MLVLHNIKLRTLLKHWDNFIPGQIDCPNSCSAIIIPKDQESILTPLGLGFRNTSGAVYFGELRKENLFTILLQIDI